MTSDWGYSGFKPDLDGPHTLPEKDIRIVHSQGYIGGESSRNEGHGAQSTSSWSNHWRRLSPRELHFLNRRSSLCLSSRASSASGRAYATTPQDTEDEEEDDENSDGSRGDEMMQERSRPMRRVDTALFVLEELSSGDEYASDLEVVRPDEYEDAASDKSVSVGDTEVLQNFENLNLEADYSSNDEEQERLCRKKKKKRWSAGVFKRSYSYSDFGGSSYSDNYIVDDIQPKAHRLRRRVHEPDKHSDDDFQLEDLGFWQSGSELSLEQDSDSPIPEEPSLLEGQIRDNHEKDISPRQAEHTASSENIKRLNDGTQYSVDNPAEHPVEANLQPREDDAEAGDKFSNGGLIFVTSDNPANFKSESTMSKVRKLAMKNYLAFPKRPADSTSTRLKNKERSNLEVETRLDSVSSTRGDIRLGFSEYTLGVRNGGTQKAPSRNGFPSEATIGPAIYQALPARRNSRPQYVVVSTVDAGMALKYDDSGANDTIYSLVLDRYIRFNSLKYEPDVLAAIAGVLRQGFTHIHDERRLTQTTHQEYTPLTIIPRSGSAPSAFGLVDGFHARSQSTPNSLPAQSQPGEDASNIPTTCTHCLTQTTPLWRRNPEGHPLCNACSMSQKLHDVVRPLSLKNDTIKNRDGVGRNALVGAASRHLVKDSPRKSSNAQVLGTTTPTSRIPQKITSDGIEECRVSMEQTTARLESHMQDILDRMMSHSSATMTQEDTRYLAGLREEWKAARKCRDICFQANQRLNENSSVIDNHATGNKAKIVESPQLLELQSVPREHEWPFLGDEPFASDEVERSVPEESSIAKEQLEDGNETEGLQELVDQAEHAHLVKDFPSLLESNWSDAQMLVPEALRWDLEFQAGVWTCTPLQPDNPKDIPLTIGNAPVVLPVEYHWPPMGGVNPPPDPRPSAPLDTLAPLTIDVIRDVFLTFEGSVGFYLLLSGLLQIIVPDDFDTAWASSHLPHKYGGMKVCYIAQTLEATMLPSTTETAKARPSLTSPSTGLSGIFRSSRPSTVSASPSLKLNDFIEARPKSNHRKEKYAGRLGLKVSKGSDPYLLMSSHIITEAMLAKSHRETIFGRSRDRFEKLDDDWNKSVEIWAGNEKIGIIEKTFDTEAEIYPNGFQHDITLIKPSLPAAIRDVTSPIPDLGWLNHMSWASLRQATSSVKILGPTESHRSAKSIRSSMQSEILIVGEGIFLNQTEAAGNSKSLRDHDASTWKTLVSRALLYRVYPDFEPPKGYSGIALYADGVREDSTQGPGVVGFQSFVQRSGHVQNYAMEGPALERRLQAGRVAFYGAFECPEELKKNYTIV